jgi:hypothetical protein
VRGSPPNTQEFGHRWGSCRRSLSSQVILHISGALDASHVLGSLELAEDLAIGFSGNVGENVEAAAVRHRDGDLVEAVLGGGLEDFIDHADRGLSTLEAEALLPDIFGLQERFKRFCLVQLREDPQLGVVVGLLVGLLQFFLEPGPLLRVLDVHVFNTDGAAVGVAQNTEDFAQQHGAPAPKTTGHKFAVQIPEGQTVALEFEVGVGALPILERVDVGHEVTANAERVDEFLNAGGLVDVSAVSTAMSSAQWIGM